MASWITTKLLGVRAIYSGGTPLPQRPGINFVGLTVTDDPANDRTTVALPSTIPGYHAFGDLEADTLLVNNTSEFDGPATFAAGASASGFTFSADITETRVAQGTPQATPTAWQASVAATWTNQATNGTLHIPLNIPNGCTILSASVKIDPPSHGASWPVQTAPLLAVKYYSMTSGLAVTIASQSDSLTSQSSYEALHSLTVSSLPAHTVDKTSNRYYLELVSEAGTNSATGTVYYSASVTYKRPAGSEPPPIAWTVGL
ncbi:MAG: hypothetical protein QM820_47155 [Minicystis sp.]